MTYYNDLAPLLTEGQALTILQLTAFKLGAPGLTDLGEIYDEEETVDMLLANENNMGFDCGFTYMMLEVESLNAIRNSLGLSDIGYDDEIIHARYPLSREMEGTGRPIFTLLCKLGQVQSTTYKRALYESTLRIMKTHYSSVTDLTYFGTVSSILD